MHHLGGGLDAPDHRLEADLDHAVDRFRRDIRDRLVAHPGGVVDQDVQPPRPLGQAQHGAAHALARRHVLDHGDRLPAGIADFPHDLLDELRLQVVDADRRAQRGKLARGRAPDAVP